MYNIFKSICSLILLVSFSHAEDKASISQDDLIEILLPMGKQCEHKPEKEHVIELIQMKDDAQMVTKCFRRCLFEQFELMPKGAKEANTDTAVQLIGMMYANKEDDIKDFTTKCNKANAGKEDDCELAHGLAMCMYAEMQERGYKIPEVN